MQVPLFYWLLQIAEGIGTILIHIALVLIPRRSARPSAPHEGMVACSPAIALISAPLILNCMEQIIEATADEDLMAQIWEGKREDAKVRDFEELALELGI